MWSSRIVFAIMSLFSIFFVLFTNLWLSYVCLFSVIIIFVLCILSVTVGKNLVVIEQELSEKSLKRGDKVVLNFKIKNRMPLPIPFFRVNLSADTSDLGYVKYVFIFVPPFFRRQIEYNINCEHIGEYNISAEYAEYYDLMCLFKAVLHINRIDSVLVCPRLLKLKDIPFEYAEILNDTGKSGGVGDDMSSILDIRQYRTTDGYKKIHWKLSSKKNELMIKNFQNTLISPTLILFDLSPCYNLTKRDDIIEYITSISLMLLENAHPVTVCYYQDEFRFINENTINGFNSLYYMFPRLKFENNIRASELIKSLYDVIINVKNIIIVTDAEDEELNIQIRELREKKYNVQSFAYNE